MEESVNITIAHFLEYQELKKEKELNQPYIEFRYYGYPHDGWFQSAKYNIPLEFEEAVKKYVEIFYRDSFIKNDDFKKIKKENDFLKEAVKNLSKGFFSWFKNRKIWKHFESGGVK